MEKILLAVPGEVLASAKIPRQQLQAELCRRLAATLYADGVIGGAAACMLVEMEKSEFQHWLGEHGVVQPLVCSDYQRHNLEEWLNRSTDVC